MKTTRMCENKDKFNIPYPKRRIHPGGILSIVVLEFMLFEMFIIHLQHLIVGRFRLSKWNEWVHRGKLKGNAFV